MLDWIREKRAEHSGVELDDVWELQKKFDEFQMVSQGPLCSPPASWGCCHRFLLFHHDLSNFLTSDLINILPKLWRRAHFRSFFGSCRWKERRRESVIHFSVPVFTIFQFLISREIDFPSSTKNSPPCVPDLLVREYVVRFCI